MNISTRLAWASAFLLAVALFYAPLAYGCARADMLPPLFALLIASTLTGAGSILIDRNWTAIPRTVLVCAVAILLQGWWIASYPVFPSMVAANGGVLETTMETVYHLSFDSMLLTTVLLLSFVVLCGLFGHPLLRRFVLLSATASGVLVCIVGVVLKIVGQPLMRFIWSPLDIYWNDFAFFRYHGNAGGFLNLVWPLILVFTRRAYAPTGGHIRKVIWTLASLTCAASLFLNAAKAAFVVGLLVFPWPFYTLLLRLKQRTLIFLAVGMVIFIAGALVALSQFAHQAAFQRITNPTEVTADFTGRWQSYQENLNAVPEVGFFGYGPGMFPLAFPYQMSPMRNVGANVRDYAHQDYLQTVLEWGWLGTMWWTLLVAGGLYRAFQTYAQRVRFTSKTERHLVLAAILGVCATLAQSLVEFPLQVASLRLFFLVLLALCWASPQLLTTSTRETSGRKRYRLPIPVPIQRLKTSSR
jgi:O-antigen ligase